MKQRMSIEIWNNRNRPHLVWIEPWASDVTVLPGQKLVLTSCDDASEHRPWFSLVESDGNTQVYIERGDYPSVELDGTPVECGHNRRVAIDAGLYH